MADEHSKGYVRVHHNGMVAMVLGLPWTPETDEYSCGALRSGGAKALGRAKGLSHAQAVADEESGCPQPCGCPPWHM